MPSTTSRLNKLSFKPGFHRESTKYAEEGSWFDGDRVRFRTGKPENMRGYSKYINTAIIGTPRDLVTWATNNTQKLIATGTEQRLNIVFNQIEYDVTPIVTVVSTTNQFSTSVGSPLIKVSLTNSNVSVGDWINFTSVSTQGFGAATNFAVSSFGGPTFQVVSLTGTNVFFISVASVAASTAANMGNGTLNFLLPSQQTTNIQGLGYGAGVYNAGVSVSTGRAWNTAAASSNIILLANQWSLDNWGQDLLAVRRGGQLIHWDAAASTVPVRASIVGSGPAKINSIVVSPNDRHVVALGASSYLTSVYSPLTVRWSDQEDYSNWTPSISSTSGEIQLIEGTQIIGGERARNQILIWTDKALYGLQFVGPPFIFQLAQLGSNCGLIGPHAGITVDGVGYWMSDSNFYKFDGRVERMNCTIRREVFDNLNISQKDKIYAGSNSEFNEVIWLIPGLNALEPTRYVIYNMLDDCWVYGSTFYTTYKDSNVFNNTITTGITTSTSTSHYYNNEPVSIYTGDGAALVSYIESAEFDIENGDNLLFVDRLIPDFTLKNGTVRFTINLQQFPNGTKTTKGPYLIDVNTDKVDFRGRGRQANFRVSTSDTNVSWRMGAVRLAIQPDGSR